MTAVLDGGHEAVMADLSRRGLSVEMERNKLKLSGASDDVLADALRDAIADSGASLRRLEPARQSLEDLFLDEVYQ